MGGMLRPRARERERRDELLSAYLDGQLGARERERLEARLATQPALRAELEALRHTVALVRDLPTVPVPRNFILAQTMAARPRPARPLRPRRAWAAPLLTAATAVVSLVFVVVLAGDLLLSGVGQVTLAPAAEQALEVEAPQVALAPSPVSETVVVEQVEVEAEVEVEKVLPAPTVAEMPVEAPREAPPEAPAEEEGYAAEPPDEVVPTEPGMGGGGPTEEPPAPAAVAPVAGEATTLTPTPAPTPSPPVVEEAAEAPKAAATATAVQARDEAAATPTPSEAGAAAPPVTGEEAPEVAAGERGVPEREAALRARISPWRVVEIVLGLAALGLALATIRAWRARRR